MSVIGKLLSEDARREMEAAVAAAPEAALVIRGTGGIRAIYFWHAALEAVYMLMAWAKADLDDLSVANRRALSRLVMTIERGRREG